MIFTLDEISSPIRKIAKKNLLLLFSLLLLQVTGSAQNLPEFVPPPQNHEFAPIHRFLASDWLEGRETGTKGNAMASDYIASMMQLYDLKPLSGNIGYFQDFEVIRYENELSGLDIRLPQVKVGMSEFGAAIYMFKSLNSSYTYNFEAPVVFAGYGVSSLASGYDDYKDLDVNGKIVLVLKGLPGEEDSTSRAWVKIGKQLQENDFGLAGKRKIAREHGAAAIIEMDDTRECFKKTGIPSIDTLCFGIKPSNNDEPDYSDGDYRLPDEERESLPCFIINMNLSHHLLNNTGIDLSEFRKKAASMKASFRGEIKDKVVRLWANVRKDTISVRNVMGMIPGRDSTNSVIVGAHYDHLGMREGFIYNGADDNASGVAGLLSLAGRWSQSGIIPEYNLIFASWTGEEKGLLGSSYFTNTMTLYPNDILLYINMDMISRSAPEDSAKNIISVGTLAADENSEKTIRSANSILSQPMILDIWDATGHTGSDYGPFAKKNIPVMTFFSGFHDDYHSPRDVYDNVDSAKMSNVLELVNGCLNSIMKSEPR
jgi:hypothetical protein